MQTKQRLFQKKKKGAHPKFNESYPPGSELTNRKTAQRIASLCGQQNLIHRTTSTAERLTETTSEIAWMDAGEKTNIFRC